MDRWKRHSSERAPGGLNHESATCVQRFDDSLIPAIHTTYRISLRSSSSREPRYPLLGVVIIIILVLYRNAQIYMLLYICDSMFVFFFKCKLVVLVNIGALQQLELCASTQFKRARARTHLYIVKYISVCALGVQACP